MKLKLSYRAIRNLGIGLLLLLVAVQGGYFIYSLSEVVAHVGHIINEDQQALTRLREINGLITRSKNEFHSFVRDEGGDLDASIQSVDRAIAVAEELEMFIGSKGKKNVEEFISQAKKMRAAMIPISYDTPDRAPYTLGKGPSEGDDIITAAEMAGNVAVVSARKMSAHISMSLIQKGDNIEKLAWDAQRYAITGVVMSLFLSLVVALFLSRGLQAPLQILANGTRQIASGDLNHRVELFGSDDVGELAIAFNEMARTLQGTTVSKDYVDNIIESMIDTLIVISPDGNIQTVNEAACRALGYKHDELIGKPIGMVIANGQDIAEESLLASLTEHSFLGQTEKIYLTKAGRAVPVLFSGGVMCDKDGGVQAIVCIARDIADRKEIEIELNRTVEELKKKTDAQDRFHGLTVGREKQMISLKEEVNELHKKLDLPEKYKAPGDVEKLLRPKKG